MFDRMTIRVSFASLCKLLIQFCCIEQYRDYVTLETSVRHVNFQFRTKTGVPQYLSAASRLPCSK